MTSSFDLIWPLNEESWLTACCCAVIEAACAAAWLAAIALTLLVITIIGFMLAAAFPIFMNFPKLPPPCFTVTLENKM